jgi:hypothetical protein
MEDNVWRVFYVLSREPGRTGIDDVALKTLALSRCRNAWESGFSVITPRYVVQLLEAPSETLPALLAGLRDSGSARLLLSEASPFRWFDGSLRGMVADAALDALIDDVVADPGATLPRGALCALADLIARRVRESLAAAANPAAAAVEHETPSAARPGAPPDEPFAPPLRSLQGSLGFAAA